MRPLNSTRVVEKVWGEEHIHIASPLYTLKTMHLFPGMQCSLHCHRQKDETFRAITGNIIVEVGDLASVQEYRLQPGETLHLPPGTYHRFRNESPHLALFQEVSTYDHPDDCDRRTASGPYLPPDGE